MKTSPVLWEYAAHLAGNPVTLLKPGSRTTSYQGACGAEAERPILIGRLHLAQPCLEVSNVQNSSPYLSLNLLKTFLFLFLSHFYQNLSFIFS